MHSGESFGKRLGIARTLSNLTQADFAKLINVRQQTVSRWEAGTSRPRLKDLKKTIDLFQIKEQEKNDWLISAGYRINSQQPKSAKTVSTISFAVPIPFSTLLPEDFERLSHELLTYLYPTGKVHRYGSLGHKQDGTDIEVRFDDGVYYDFQCKRHQEFGEAKVKDAVKKYCRLGQKKYILLARVASPKARNEVSKHSQWDIWDAEDLALKIRTLSTEKSCKLIDRFFPGQRFVLLGIQEAGPWQTADDFFRPYNDKSKFFNHKWTLVGQSENLKKIIEYVEDKITSIIFISGTGGSGKSKLLYEISNIVNIKHPSIHLRITLPTEKLTEKSIEDLGEGEKVLVIDDAHEQENINLLFQIAATSSFKTKLIILTRPYGFDKLRITASKFGLTNNNVATISISALNELKSTELASEALSQFNGPTYLAADIAKLTRGCPFATVLGSYLVAKKRIYPSTLTNQDEFRREILYRFEGVIAGDLASPTDAHMLQQLLKLIALVQPFSLDDEDFRRLTKEIIDPHFDKTAKLISLLIKNNILIKRRNLFQISPDPLSDFIIEDSCIIDGVSTGLAERIFDKVSGAQLEKLLHSIGKLVWRLSSADKPHGNILDTMWNRLENLDNKNFSTPEEIIRAIASVACYQPEKALAFADKLIYKKVYLSLVPQILKNIAYNSNFIKVVCVRLWGLGKDDLRSIKQNPNHPIHVLIELGRIEQNKPVEYCEPVVEFGLSLINEESAWQDKFTPLDILNPILATESEATKFSGLTVTFSRSQVLYQVVEQLRATVIDALLALIANQDIKKAINAAKVLRHALRYSMSTQMTEQAALTSEFKSTLIKLKNIIQTKELKHLVLIEILRTVNWHANNGEEETSKIANEIISLFPADINLSVMRALIDGWGQLWKREQDYSLQQENWQKEMDDIASELLVKYSKEYILELIKSNLNMIYSCEGMIDSSPHIFINLLSKKSLDFSKEIVDVILQNPRGEFAPYVGSALSEITSHDRVYGLSISRKFIETKEPYLLYAVAQSFILSEGNGNEFSDDEIDLIRKLCDYENLELLTITLIAVEKIGYKNQLRALDILLNIDFKNSSKIADAVLRLFYPNKAILSDYYLDEKTYEIILGKLYAIPKLEGHWLENFISRASYEQPGITADFMMRRVSLAVEKSDFNYRPFNYGVFLHAPFRFYETNSSILVMGAVREWMRTSNKSRWFRKYSSMLFFTMFHPIHINVIEFLKEWISGGLQSDLEIVIDILSAEASDFVIQNPVFVEYLLHSAEKFGQECLDESVNLLFGSAISGSRSGIFGQPYPKDTFLSKESTIILNQLSPISPAYRLYEYIFTSCNESIARSKKDLEWFEDDQNFN